MFDTLSDRLSSVFSKLTGRGLLTEANVDDALREVRRALLEADVALEVVKDFLAKVREKAIGEEVIKSVSPGQTVIKIVNDQLTELLGSENVELNLRSGPPSIIMMVGLQGSGKTTTSAKLANYVRNKSKLKTLMASLDVTRPAAQEQLEILGAENAIETLPIIKGQKPTEITKRACKEAKLGGFDVLILDTAGRMNVDDELMDELQSVNKIAEAHNVILVADSLTGQDAVNVADTFSKKIPLTGVILTRLDGDARGGAALSMRHVTGKPILFAGIGEKIENLEVPEKNSIVNSNKETRILWSAPRTWLIYSRNENIIKTIKGNCKETDFAITNISHSRAVIRIQGFQAKEILKKGSPINFNEFGVNKCVGTVFHGITIVIDSISNNPETFNLLVLRSFGESFYHHITDAALEFGYVGI